MKHFINKKLILLFILILLSGCAALPSRPYQHETTLSPTAKDYLQKASAVAGDKNHRYLLLAAHQLLIDNNIKDAQQLLAALNATPLNSDNLQQKRIMLARLALQKNQPRLALRELRNVKNLRNLPKNIQILYYAASIDIYLHNNNLAYSTIARISSNTLVDDPKIQLENDRIIWQNLQAFPLITLNKLFDRSSSSLLRGWFQLAIVSKQNANTPVFLASALKTWQQTYSNHPANNLLSNTNINALINPSQPLTQIALLLPLHGKFTKMGQAVKNGLMTAYYANTKKTSHPINIKIYDTSQDTDVATLYQKALQQGAQFVVGPLTKTNVLQLVKRKKTFPIPTLLLNYLTKNQSTPQNIIQIGLSSEQEAAQAAEQAWQHNVNRILILTTEGEWGNKIQRAFIAHFQQLGGRVMERTTISKTKKLAFQIAAALNINQSKARAAKLQNILGENFKKTDRRRQDINGIFFVATTPAQARQINPLLRFYYAGNLPAFSISTLYTGYPNRRRDNDLNGIYFNDIPWVLSNTQNIKNLKQPIRSLWLTNYQNNNRLYGLGVDAFTLTKLFNRLILLPNFAVNGVTGLLFLDSNNQIYSQLLPAQFEHGIPQLKNI